MNESEAYAKLQELLALAEEIAKSEHYSADEIVDEVKNRLEA